MSSGRRAGLLWLLILSVGLLVADQLSKRAVEQYTAPGSQRVLIPGLLNLDHTSNTGVAFGLLSDSKSPWLPFVLILFSIFVIGFLVWLLASGRAGGRLGEVGIAMILGGACGNVLDRFLRRSVTDFIDFHLGNYHWYTFNIADSAIVVGAALVLLELLRDWRHPTHEKA